MGLTAAPQLRLERAAWTTEAEEVPEEMKRKKEKIRAPEVDMGWDGRLGMIGEGRRRALWVFVFILDD